MNDVLPPPPPPPLAADDYHYEPPYVTLANPNANTSSSTSIKTSEVSTGLYRYTSAGSLGGFRMTSVPTEFAGTHKSSNKASPTLTTYKVGIHNHPPNRTHHGQFCSCFGSAVAADISFWPALLANFGICLMLMGYIFFGSFIFLTIESTAANDSSADHYPLQTARTSQTKSTLQGSRVFDQIPSALPVNPAARQQPQHQEGFAAAARSDGDNATTLSGIRHSPLPSPGPLLLSSIAVSTETSDDFGNDEDEHEHEDEDVERQRAVENIWDITVSLNILYKENWTKLAAMEIAKFQDQLVKRLSLDSTLSSPLPSPNVGKSPSSSGRARFRIVPAHQQNTKQYDGTHQYQDNQYEWNFATAFLYSLTVITTIGYGNVAPCTAIGRMATICYATLGIPLTLVYLSSVGGVLAKLVREVCARALCCYLCSNCGYCFYDEQHMAQKATDLKMKRQHQQDSKLRAKQNHLAYCYVRPPPTTTGAMRNDLQLDSFDSISSSAASESRHSSPLVLTMLAPIALCLTLMIVYIMFGSLAFAALEEWPIIDGVYFCFMSLTTIGFGDLLPGGGNGGRTKPSPAATWFCSMYILSGLTLTAMCINVLHDEILQRMRIIVKFKKVAAMEAKERNYYVSS